MQDAKLIIKPTFPAINQPVNFSVTMVMFLNLHNIMLHIVDPAVEGEQLLWHHWVQL